MATSCFVEFDSLPLFAAAAVESFCTDGSALMIVAEVHSEGDFEADFGSGVVSD